jgi:hypothetical protein
MEQLIKVFRDKSFIKFDKGKFDNWCVYLYRPGIGIYAPGDIEYFNFFRNASLLLTPEIVYYDFVEIYSKTNQAIEQSTLSLIEITAQKYPDKKITEIWFTVIYSGMVAEENKENAILKKRIKRLAMHQVLIENFNPEIASKYSIGKSWQELDKECQSRGF